MTFKKLYTYSIPTLSSYEDNLQAVIRNVIQSEDNSIILFPELCLTGFDYENIKKAVNFTKHSLEMLLPYSTKKIIILTAFEEINDKTYNSAFVLYNEKVVYKQSKVMLFKLGNEDKNFTSGIKKDILKFEIDGIVLAVLICFELRFKELWIQVEGADIVLIPAQWGKIRADHFSVLTHSLAIVNQCYVMASDAKNSETTCTHYIISPFGISEENGVEFSKKEIIKMRKYLDVGIREKGA